MAEWPDWTPPQDMIARQPYLPRWMAGGKGNPLGARAIYLGSTVYRIHGTNAPATIGTRVSSGCFRMIDADVIDLYSRVRVGTKIVVLSNHSQAVRKAPAPSAASPAPAVASLRATGIY
jgi:lipoprotein-anchoring transpeptidase ErfK/SrfK